MSTKEPPGEPSTYGLILAGGLARRMGGCHKPLIRVGGPTILERAIARVTPQCAGLVINANGDVSRFSRFGFPAVADDIEGFAVPLVGIQAGLARMAANPPASAWIRTDPGDSSFMPRDIVALPHAAPLPKQLPLACARSGEWRHPVV